MVFRKKAATLLSEYRPLLAETLAKIKECEQARGEKLRADADAGRPLHVSEIDANIVALQADVRNYQTLIADLELRVEEEKRADVAQRQTKHIAAVEAQIDEYAAEFSQMQKDIGVVAGRFHKVIELGLKIATANSWGAGVQETAAFIPSEIKRLVMYEIARVGSGRVIHAGAVQRPSFPGGQIPRLDWLHQPEKIPPLIDSIAERAAYAKKILRGVPVANATPATTEEKVL